MEKKDTGRCDGCESWDGPFAVFQIEEYQAAYVCLACLKVAVALLEQASEQPRHNYTGEIETGNTFVWMHGTSNEERITVLEQRNGWIKSHGSRSGDCWNSEDVFRESVIKDTAPDQQLWSAEMDASLTCEHGKHGNEYCAACDFIARMNTP